MKLRSAAARPGLGTTITKATRTIAIAAAFAVAAGCGRGDGPKKPTAEAAPKAAAVPAAEPAAGKSLQKIADFAEAWNQLYKQNEKSVNNYQGMPIIELVTPPLTFAIGVQFDLMNTNAQDGRFDGKMLLAGWKGFVERSGSRVVFGYDDKLEKDGFGPAAKAGDRVVGNGTVDFAKGSYLCETATERAGKKIVRDHTEFRRLADGSMICLSLNGHAFDGRGDASLRNEVIYLHNGAGRYDFVVGKAKTGPDFATLSLAEKGDLTKQQALDLVKASGYAIEASGGIRDGQLVLDK